MIVGHLGELSASQGPLAKESVRVRISKDVTVEAEIGMMSSEMKEGATNQGRQAASRS